MERVLVGPPCRTAMQGIERPANARVGTTVQAVEMVQRAPLADRWRDRNAADDPNVGLARRRQSSGR